MDLGVTPQPLGAQAVLEGPRAHRPGQPTHLIYNDCTVLLGGHAGLREASQIFGCDIVGESPEAGLACLLAVPLQFFSEYGRCRYAGHWQKFILPNPPHADRN